VPDIDTELMGCCGLNGIYNLSNRICDCGDEECTGDGPQGAYDSILDAVEDESHTGIIIAVTNQQQEEDGIGHQLTRAGFHPVLNTLNTNSNNRITLWVRDHTEGKVPEKLITHGGGFVDLRQAVQQYVNANPNPRSTSAQRLVTRYRELFPEQVSS